MAVHFAEDARDSYGTNSKLAWEKVLLPAVAAFSGDNRLVTRPVVVNEESLNFDRIDDTFAVDSAFAIDQTESEDFFDSITAKIKVAQLV